MKCEIINEDNLKENEIDEIVIRTKAFIINDKNEILVALSNGGVQLVGGHVEKNEEYEESLKREILEEAGIVISDEKLDQFYEIKYYDKNHRNSNKNRLSIVIYYIIKTNKIPDKGKASLTELEKGYDFNVEYVPFNNFEEYVKGYLNSEKEINRGIAKELLMAFDELKKVYVLK